MCELLPSIDAAQTTRRFWTPFGPPTTFEPKHQQQDVKIEEPQDEESELTEGSNDMATGIDGTRRIERAERRGNPKGTRNSKIETGNQLPKRKTNMETWPDEFERKLAEAKKNPEKIRELIEHQTCAQAIKKASRLLRKYFRDIEDICQEVILEKLLQKPEYITEAENIETAEDFARWIYIVLKHACIDAERRKKHEENAGLFQHDSTDSEGRTMSRKLQEKTSWIDDFEGRYELRELVERLLNRLPQGLREVIRLHFWEDLSCQEIGDLLGITRMAVNKRINKAMAIMRQHEPIAA